MQRPHYFIEIEYYSDPRGVESQERPKFWTQEVGIDFESESGAYVSALDEFYGVLTTTYEENYHLEPDSPYKRIVLRLVKCDKKGVMSTDPEEIEEWANESTILEVEINNFN